MTVAAYRNVVCVMPYPDDPEPCIVMYGYMSTDEVTLLDSITVGPFPDWESIARRVMRRVIEAGKVSMR